MKRNLLAPLTIGTLLLSMSAATAFAQSPDDSAAGSSYQISPDSTNTAPVSPAQADTTGPVRLARFSLVSGDVSWRPTASDDWSTAGVNVPLREGAQIWVTNGGRAEIQFDDGSYVRVGDGAIITLQTLYSDANGEFTELNLTQGLATLDLKNESSIYQLDTPLTSIKAAGQSNVRVGVNDGVEVAVHSGKAVVTGPGGSVDIQDGSYLYLADATSQYDISPIPEEDSWDRWNDAQDQSLADSDTEEHCPENIALCAGNLDSYGDWRHDPQYGWVWYPQVDSADWRPYEQGSWVYCQPFGWTWCSSEPWGWAPYHYGTWFHSDAGWAWCPGPQRQYWSPAVVSFTNYNGNVGWCPLAPHEVNYAAISLSFGGHGFFAGFSIGQAGCYYPNSAGVCQPRAFGNNYVNHFGRPGFDGNARVTNITNINVTNIQNTNFVPINSRHGGVMTASAAAFGGTGNYHPAATNGDTYFTRGQVVAAPRAGVRAFSGPSLVRPNAASWTPSRMVESNVQPPRNVVERQVVRAPLPANVARVAAPVNTTSVGQRTTTYAPRTNFTPQQGIAGNTAAERANQARSEFNGGVSPYNQSVQQPYHNPNVSTGTPNPGPVNPIRTYQGTVSRRAPQTSTPTPVQPQNESPAPTVRQNYTPAPVQRQNYTPPAPATHIPDYGNQNNFRIDERNSGGGYSAQPARSMTPPTSNRSQPSVTNRPQSAGKNRGSDSAPATPPQKDQNLNR